ncbi:glutathione peroxidase [Brachybacterium sp. Marseille-Q7125]|uniref:glutathione peroxidase n=1 Tax=Brachybacterium sp. Marseille-Q7125 TaxID=2932815 RepID=UPI001FF23FED|nr:glutathione peroxidase [Brachybacterium sp. Marseille-Q7125]
MTTLADFTAAPLTGPDQEQDLAEHVGSVVLVVNTASKCGHTPQYAALQDLYQRFRDKGLVILGFPCDQFKHQEPGSAEEIAEFCSVNYGVTFPMFAKIDVNGEHAHPLYQWLTGEHPSAGVPAGDIEWNFAKFLLGRDGQVIARYAPDTPPADLTEDIERAL